MLIWWLISEECCNSSDISILKSKLTYDMLTIYLYVTVEWQLVTRWLMRHHETIIVIYASYTISPDHHDHWSSMLNWCIVIILFIIILMIIVMMIAIRIILIAISDDDDDWSCLWYLLWWIILSPCISITSQQQQQQLIDQIQAVVWTERE